MSPDSYNTCGLCTISILTMKSAATFLPSTMCNWSMRNRTYGWEVGSHFSYHQRCGTERLVATCGTNPQENREVLLVHTEKNPVRSVDIAIPDAALMQIKRNLLNVNGQWMRSKKWHWSTRKQSHWCEVRGYRLPSKIRRWCPWKETYCEAGGHWLPSTTQHFWE